MITLLLAWVVAILFMMGMIWAVIDEQREIDVIMWTFGALFIFIWSIMYLTHYYGSLV